MHKQPFTAVDAKELNRQFGQKTPLELLQWAALEFGDRIALCSAFGPEGMVLLHLVSQLQQPVRVFTLDTGRLPQETHELIQRCEERYRISIDVYAPEPTDLREMIKQHGINLFYQSVELRELCCEVRKVRPLIRALHGLSAWITGLRRSQAASRQEIERLEIDTTHDNILKLNPLAGWSEQQVWDYINDHQLPYNTLHDRGYRSIGCAPCTRPTNPGEDLRAGRWWWENTGWKECGLHTRVMRNSPDDAVVRSSKGAEDSRR
jgi:thioredoxin-dependent adenylylsulfate APS reductase